MTPPGAGAATNRRHFLGLLGLGAVAVSGGGVLAACGEKSANTGSTTPLDRINAIMPRQKALSGLPQPDIAGTRPVADAYTRYPPSLIDAVTDKPGRSGKTIKAMTPAWGSAPPGLGQNQYYEAVNAELGIQVDFSIQDGVTYADKLNAILAARDVPDLLCVPSWETAKIPKLTDAVKALFEDITDHLKGGAVDRYPMLATLPTESWRWGVWAERLYAIPNPGGGFPFGLFYRKDLLDAKGLTAPKTIDELYRVLKEVTKPDQGVWGANDIYAMVQMFYKVPGSRTGWRLKPDGTPEHKYETAEFRQATEFTARLHRDGLIHPDSLANRGSNDKQLMQSGKIYFLRDGFGVWKEMTREQRKITPGFKLAPVYNFSATGGDPLVHWEYQPISYTFIKKGLGRDRVEEILRVVNWCSAPYGTREWETREFGAEGRHFTRTAAGPARNELGFKEIANQYFFISGRSPINEPAPDLPDYLPELMDYSNKMAPFIEKDPWGGIKIDWPAAYASNTVPIEDQINDVVRGRRPLTDLDGIVKEWRSRGGDEARDLLGKALS